MSSAQAILEDSEPKLKNVDFLWHLEQASLTRGLSLENLQSLRGACQNQVFAKGEVLFREGDRAEALFILNRGAVRVTLGSSEGGQKIVGLYGTGDIFGEDVIADQATHQTQAVAHEESWVSRLDGQILRQLTEEIPRLALNIARLLHSKLCDARREIQTLSFSPTEARIAKMLLKLSGDHGKDIVMPTEFRKLKIPVSHEHLAQLIGANRPHVSSIMSKLRKRGLVRYQNRKLLIKVKELSEMLARSTD